MKLTLMRDYGETSTMRTLDINLQIEAMKHETKARPISNLRTNIRYASPDTTLEEAQRLTKVILAANFRKTANGAQMTEYNGIVQIEVNHLANRTEVNRVKQEAAELTQTFAAFMGSGGHSVKYGCASHARTIHYPKAGKKRKYSKPTPTEKQSACTNRLSPTPSNLRTLLWSNSAGKPTTRNFITTLMPPSSTCVNRWKCRRTPPTKNPYKRKHRHSNG